MSTSKSALRAVLFAGAVGLAFAASPANAQDSGRYSNAAYQDSESVQVTAPRFRVDSSRLNGPLERISLSTSVRYDDLNLRTRRGARMLKWRVRDSAQQVCTQLGEAYPVYQANGTSCYKTALQNGSLRADAAIRDARDYPRNYRS
ncbi:MAG TPA: UrcA family protein [Rhizomicrobium sp.]